jgi:hypothetical protein
MEGGVCGARAGAAADAAAAATAGMAGMGTLRGGIGGAPPAGVRGGCAWAPREGAGPLKMLLSTALASSAGCWAGAASSSFEESRWRTRVIRSCG